eukprot:6174590-Pleurochrysis_carterae.AAC.1
MLSGKPIRWNTHDSVENVPQESVRTRLTARSGICISETWGSSIAVIDSGRSEYFTPTHGVDSGLAVTLRLRIRLCFPCPPHVVVSYTIGPGLRLSLSLCVCLRETGAWLRAFPYISMPLGYAIQP